MQQIITNKTNAFLGYWVSKISYSIIDQGLLSGANFILNILLAKRISPDEYGVFGITFAVFLFLSGFHNALLIEPLVVIGPTRYSNQIPRYLTIIVCVHFVFALAITITLLCIAPFLVWWRDEISLWMLVSLSFSSFSILLFWLLRRAAYLEGNAVLACIGSSCYTCTLIVGMLWFNKQSWFSAINAYLLMSVASLASAAILWRRLGINLKSIQVQDDQLTIKNVVAQHWHYGRWIVAGTLAYSFSTLIYVPLVGAFVGLAASGVLRAMQNLVQPVQQIIVALSTFFVPWLSKQRNIQGSDYPLRALPKILFLFLGIGIGFLLPLVLLGPSLVHFIYDNDFYTKYTWVLHYVGIAILLQILVYAIATVARAIEYPSAIFGEELAGACFVLTIGILLIWKWELNGAVISLVGSAFSQLLVMAWLIRHKLRST